MPAPGIWDAARLVTSIFLAVESLSLDDAEGERLARVYLNRYAQTLSSGSIRTIVADNAKGIVAELLKKLARRKRRELLDEQTELSGEVRQLKFDDKILKIDRGKYERATGFF
jgi:uncharacterized protein (DUF2252 family)